MPHQTAQQWRMLRPTAMAGKFSKRLEARVTGAIYHPLDAILTQSDLLLSPFCPRVSYTLLVSVELDSPRRSHGGLQHAGSTPVHPTNPWTGRHRAIGP